MGKGGARDAAEPGGARLVAMLRFAEGPKQVTELLSLAQLVEYVQKLITHRGLVAEVDPQYPHLLRVGASLNELAHEAEHVRMLKRTRGSTPDAEDDVVEWEEFKLEDRERFDGWGTDCFFTPSEEAWLLDHILQQIHTDGGFAALTGHTTQGSSQPLLDACFHTEVLASYNPIHVPKRRWALWDRLLSTREMFKMRKNNQQLFSDADDVLQDLRDYYGEGVAFYFAWMEFYGQMLVVPGICSLLLYLLQPAGMTVDNNPYVPFFSIFVVIWAFFFVKQWRRRSTELAFRWNTLTVEKESLQAVRPAFYGVQETSPITGQPELHYKAWKRRCKYLVSTVVTTLMLSVAFAVMICSLNLQGYISKQDRFGNRNPFYVAVLTQYSQPGAIFDPESTIMFIVPVILHSVTILILNQFVYRKIASSLTEWENHRTDSSFENSLILKRFFFEAFDCYIALFYLAFYEANILRLREELMALFITDCLRRVATETLLPLIVQTVSYRMTHKAKGGAAERPVLKRKLSGFALATEAIKAAVDDDDAAEEYEQFDDYLEMIIQFGYITLFASAFPLASFLSLITTLVEKRSDVVKLTLIARRPRVQRASNIGTWEVLFTAMVWLSALTNCLIFGFASEQMMQWLPSLFQKIQLQTQFDKLVAEGSGRYVVGLIFTFEHLLILVGLCVSYGIKDIPKWVRVRLARRDFLVKQKMFELRRQAREKRLARIRASLAS